MKYWIDTEFIERPYTIDLISIGIVAEDGREFYAESSEVDWSKASLWTLENVRPQLDGKGTTREEIGYALREFTDGDEHPVFWGYFPAYDWVAFTWLFGRMDEMPFHYPQLCLDIKQWAIGVSSEGHAVMSVKVRPEPKDSGSEAREALWRESKTAEPSDNILERSMREASGCNVQ